MRIVLDLQGCQSASRFRGIGRYSMALAQAIVRNAGQHEIWVVLSDAFPDSIESIRASFAGLLPSERIAVFAMPSVTPYQGLGNWRVAAARLIREYAIAELEPDLVHISSLFEGYVDQSTSSVKAFDANVVTAVTLYDLIPFLNPERYLADPGVRQHYNGKIDALKRADVLLAISQYCAEEASRELGIPGERIINISSGVSGAFKRVELSEQAVRDLYKRYSIERPFVMTTGIVESRKNLERLIVAYSKLPIEVRHQHQLFLACQATEAQAMKLNGIAKANGLRHDEMVLGSYIPDADLVALYNQCRLFVFPSLHEGFGLPALEAMAAGAAVIGSNTTSIPEVIARNDALFDPLNVSQMTSMMRRALTDDEFAASLREDAIARASRFSWDETGRRAVRAFEAAVEARSAGISAAENATANLHHSRESADNRYHRLIEALRKLDASAMGLDYIAAADAIAANQRTNRDRQLLVDVSVLSEVDAKSGIQRVTRAILRQLMTAAPTGWKVRPVRLERSTMGYRYANEFWRGLDFAPDAPTEGDDWVDTQSGDVFFGLDLVADRIPQAERWFLKQRRRGVHIYFVVYDLLPVRRPEWFHEGIAGCFPPWLKTIATVSDGLIGISRAVADDLKDWLDSAGVERLRELKLGYFHLGADIENSQPSKGMPDDAPRLLEAMRSKPTFLMVGTVEPRKGHDQAIAAFNALWAADTDVNLVVVGKAGWGLNGFDRMLREHPEAGKRFLWIDGASDEYLDQIYGAATCLIVASKGEGFGLPLIEAAQKGLPIIARDIPVFREVAAEHALYFDGDGPDILAQCVRESLRLMQTGAMPPSTGMASLTWAESANRLKSVLLEDSWYTSWKSVPAVV
jgi:glycosyltransferase involved in cell wall biosynthesis